MDWTEQIWNLARPGFVGALLGSPVPAPPEGWRVVRARCGTGDTLGRLREQIGHRGAPRPGDPVVQRVASGLRKRLLGEPAVLDEVGLLIAELNQLADGAPRVAILLDDVDQADPPTLALLRRTIGAPGSLRPALLLSARAMPPAGPAAALLRRLERGGQLVRVPAALPELPAAPLRVLRALAVAGGEADAARLAELLGEDELRILERAQEARDLGFPVEDRGEGRLAVPPEPAAALVQGLMPSLAEAWRRRLGHPPAPARAPEAPIPEPFGATGEPDLGPVPEESWSESPVAWPEPPPAPGGGPQGAPDIWPELTPPTDTPPKLATKPDIWPELTPPPEEPPKPDAAPDIWPELTPQPEEPPKPDAAPDIWPELTPQPEDPPKPDAAPDTWPELTPPPEEPPKPDAAPDTWPELTPLPEDSPKPATNPDTWPELGAAPAAPPTPEAPPNPWPELGAEPPLRPKPAPAPEPAGTWPELPAGPRRGAAPKRPARESAGPLEAAVRELLAQVPHAPAYAAPQVIAQLREALAQLDRRPPSPERQALRARVHMELGRVAWMDAGILPGLDLHAALRELDHAAALLEQLPGEARLRAELRVLAASVCYDRGDPPALERALSELTEAIRAFSAAGDPRTAARLLNDQAAVWVRIGDVVRAAHLLRESRQIQGRSDDPEAVAELAETNHLLARLPLHVPPRPGRERDALRQALAHAAEAEAAYGQLVMRREQARTWSTIGRLHLLLGELPLALELLRRAIAAQEQLGDALGLAQSAGALSEALAHQGELAQAIETLSASIGLNANLGSAAGLRANRESLDALARATPPEDAALRKALRRLQVALDGAERPERR